ncbi:MAG TPA: HWE histidine kinase domain-containing protein, partial [Steroidobacteraceae bacterium]|nr:HWE histidine kinase domain-containing protein [Steroidobacteraceae bacterium]
GRLVAALVLHSDVPRVWTDAATVLAEQVLERTWRWMERERALERERMMAREIDHRARNALAVVQSLVRQTRADAIDEFREKLDDRIAALARAHGLLSDERWTAVDLGALIQQELDPYLAGDRPRVRLKGRKLPLPPPLAQSMALVLHELTTNAVKHGALADDGGQLEIAWQADGSGDLIIDWCEMAGRTIAPVDAQREGFGSVLFDSVIERQLRGRIDRTWASDGLQCRISIPATDARADEVAQDDVSERPPTGAIRVLLAEDEAIVALDVATMIEDLGYDLVRVCYTLDEALAAVAEEDLEVAVLDANLGGRSSMPVAELLHGRGVPVIFATGYQEMPDLPDALQGAPRLTKPVSRAMLAAALEQTLPATS